MNIAIVGNGRFGTALSSVLSKNTPRVTFWDRKETLSDADVILIAVPTKAIRDVLSVIRPKKTALIVNTAKGIEQETHLLPFQIIEKTFPKKQYFSLIGPSFAQEVSSQMPTLVNVGYFDKTHVEKLKNLFQTDYFRVRATPSIRSLELAGAMKNIYAIACGLSYGLGYRQNTQAKLIVLAYEECRKLCESVGFTIDESALPGILGDLILTCSSTESRNFTFGTLLATHTVEQALTGIISTVEGYHTAFSLPDFSHAYGVSLPLASLVSTIIIKEEKRTSKQYFSDFITHV